MSIENIQELNVGLNGAVDFKPIKMKQFDKNTRRIEITLLSGSDIYEIPDGAVAKFQATKPDGTIVFDDCSIENEKVIYKAAEKLSTYPGTVKCEIGIYDPDANGDTSKDGLLQSATFNILVEESAMDRNAVISSNEFNTLTIMINTITGLVERAENIIEEINIAISNTESAIANTEIAINNAEQATSEAQQATATINATNQTIINSENTRIESENIRQSDEIIRQSQESTRQVNTTDAINRADAATTRANLAAEACEDIASGIIELPDIGTPGTYTKVTTDSKGRVVEGNSPTNIEDLGVTNVYNKSKSDTLIDAKIDKTSIANNLITNVSGTVLGGEQGKILNDKIGTLSDLTTTAKTDLVGSVNEIKASVDVVNNNFINVKNFGAKGDGIADDTVSIQSAIDNLKLTGGILFLPKGIYLFSSLDVSGCDKLNIIGSGIGVSILRQTSTTLDAIKCTSETWWQSFKDFTIDSSVSKTSGSMFYFVGGKRTLFESVDIKNWYNGINFESYENCWINRCSLTEPSGSGNAIICGKISNSHMGANLYITECFIRGNNIAKIGIQILDTDAVFCTGNDIGAVNCCLKIEPSTISDNHYFVQNWFDSTHKGNCVEIGGDGVKRDIAFTGCWFASAGKSGDTLGVENCLKITGNGAYGSTQFTGCKFFNSSGSGIYIDSPYANAVFTGCVIRECGNSNTPNNNYGLFIGTNGDTFVKYTGGSIQSLGDSVYTTPTSRGYSFDSVTMFGNVNNNGTAKSFSSCTSTNTNTIESANALKISPTKNVYYVTGTTNIISINKTYPGHVVTFRFNGVLVVVTQNNIHMKNDFTTSVGSTLTLVYDESYEAWLEVGRVN